MNIFERWRINHKFKRAMKFADQALKEIQEANEFIDANWGLFFDDEFEWAIYKSKRIEGMDKLIAEIAKVDQIQAKYRDGKDEEK